MSRVYENHLAMEELAQDNGWQEWQEEQERLTREELDKYYQEHQEELEEDWEEYVNHGEWGSGEDRIRITDDMFWEFVQDKMDQENMPENKAHEFAKKIIQD